MKAKNHRKSKLNSNEGLILPFNDRILPIELGGPFAELSSIHHFRAPLLVTPKVTEWLLSTSGTSLWRITNNGELPKYDLLDGSVRFRYDEIVTFVEGLRRIAPNR